MLSNLKHCQLALAAKQHKNSSSQKLFNYKTTMQEHRFSTKLKGDNGFIFV